MRVLLFNRSLNSGGSEQQLTVLARALHQRGVPVAVAVFYGQGPLRQTLEDAGVEVIDLAKAGRWDVVRCLWRTWRAFRSWRPDVIYCFIGTGLAAALIKPLLHHARLVWGVRSSDHVSCLNDWFNIFLGRANQSALKHASIIITNSWAGRRHVMSQGVDGAVVSVVPNGIDTNRYRYDPMLRVRQRQAWGIDDQHLLVGLVARLDYDKDHATFLAAAAMAGAKRPDLHFVCVGTGPEPLRADLEAKAKERGLTHRLTWAGHCFDLAAVYSALDVLALASTSEGFPNVIGEGMACGLPVVATDVGDCRRIVAGHGWIVPPADPQALAEALRTAAGALDGWDRSASRRHIVQNYSVSTMVDDTLAVLARLRGPCASSMS